MLKEPSDEVIGLELHGLLFITVSVVPPEEGNHVVVNLEDAVIADCDPMGISAEVLKDALRSIEGGFAIDDPLLMVELSSKAFEDSRIFEMTDITGEDKITCFEAVFESVKELAPEQ
jgi:hypothetical protein